MAPTSQPRPDQSLIQETHFTAPAPDIEALPAQNASQGDSNPTSTSLQPTKLPRAIAPDLLRALIVVLQALDHSALIAGAWRHGTAILTEEDGQIVTEWNIRTAWVARMLTHLCAPGFMFLLGMGIVYFGRSRTRLGWSTWKFVKHFLIRAAVLVVLNELLGVVATRGRVWVLNIVLLALAFNYVVTGLLWLGLNKSENALHSAMSTFRNGGDNVHAEEQPLLRTMRKLDGHDSREQLSGSLSFHVHNMVLLLLTVVTIFWNIWLSPTGAHRAYNSQSSSNSVLDTELARAYATSGPQPLTLYHFLFHDVNGLNNKFISPFPPLAWISFAIFGVLYGRLVIHYSHLSAAAFSGLNALSGVCLAILFVCTRLLHVGNLSEGCLQMPENIAHPHRNQYLVSFRAFFYVVKYPPSPAFFCYSMAVNFLLLSVFAALPVNTTGKLDRIEEGSISIVTVAGRLTNVLCTILLPFGQSALFFYALHLPLYAVLGTLAKLVWARPLGWKDPNTGQPAVGLGNSPIFWVMYLIGLVILWVACRRYAKFKSSRGPESVFRFF